MRSSDRTWRMLHLGVGEPADLAYGSAWEAVAGVSGCAMLVSRDVFDAIGLLEETYFFSFEDLAFCLRAREHGFEVGVTGRTAAYHEGSRSIGQTSARRLYFGARNHLRLSSTRPGGWLRRTGRETAVVGYSLAYAVTAPNGHVIGRLTAVAQGVRDHLRGSYGPDPDV